jgi:hypothetical protein
MFTTLLKRSGITKAELSRRFGMAPQTITSWKEHAPEYAIAYLKLLVEYNRVRP